MPKPSRKTLKQGWPVAPSVRCTGPMKASTRPPKTRSRLRLIGALVLALVLLWVVGGWAQPLGPTVRLDPYDYEQVVVSATAVGLTDAKVVPPTGRPAEYVEITVEDNNVRCTVDGTTPTSVVGHFVPKDTRLALVDTAVIDALACIRIVGDAKLSVTYYRRVP